MEEYVIGSNSGICHRKELGLCQWATADLFPPRHATIIRNFNLEHLYFLCAGNPVIKRGNRRREEKEKEEEEEEEGGGKRRKKKNENKMGRGGRRRKGGG